MKETDTTVFLLLVLRGDTKMLASFFPAFALNVYKVYLFIDLKIPPSTLLYESSLSN